MRSKLIFLVSALGLLPSLVAAEQRPITGQEIAYINLLKHNNVEKAKEVAELGNVKPLDVAGKPIIDWIWNESFGFAPYISWPMMRYFIEDLKISPNTRFSQGKDHSVMAQLCMPDVTRGFQPSEQFGQRMAVVKHDFVDKYKYMLDHGGSAKPFASATGMERNSQPLPLCMETYYQYWNRAGGDPDKSNYERRDGLRQVIDLLLTKGAPINYSFGNAFDSPKGTELPVFVTAIGYDQDLLGILVKHGAKISDTLTLSMPSTCGNPHLKLSVLNFLPTPLDRDIMRAEPYLAYFVGMGGDIKQKLPIGSNCSRRYQTLKEAALGAGQVEYAKMVLKLEKENPGQMIGATEGEPDPE